MARPAEFPGHFILEELDGAATKLQAVQRGRKTRQEVTIKRTEKAAAEAAAAALEVEVREDVMPARGEVTLRDEEEYVNMGSSHVFLLAL